VVEAPEYQVLGSDTLPSDSKDISPPEEFIVQKDPMPPMPEVPEFAEEVPEQALPLNDSIFEYEETPQDPFQEKVSSLKKGILGENINSAAFGMLYKNRSGAGGMDGGNMIVLPALDVDLYHEVSHHFYGHLNFVSLYNGELSDDISGLYGVPKAKLGGNIKGINYLVEPKGGYKYNGGDWSLQGELGTIPQPSPAETKTLWKLKYAKSGEKVSGDITFVQDSIKDTILSRVGDTFNYIKDSNSTAEGVRGAVTKQGLIFGMKYSNPDEVVAGNLSYYYDISGTNVYPNREIALTVLYVRQLKVPDFNFFMLGPIFIYDNYDYNSNYFTMGVNNNTGEILGNGGYFSPTNFMLLGVYLDMAQMLTPDFLWRIKGNVGLINFENGADLFGDTEKMSVSGVGYDIKGFLGYRFEPEFEILAEAGFAASGSAFSTFFFGISGVYYFGGKEKANMLDLERSNIIEEFVQ
jgi:hypothetical protein